jgi:hypothetical protein
MGSIKVKYSKLGRNKVWGYAHSEDNSIEIDIRAKGKKHCEILVHEAIHLLFPELEEEEVVKKSKLLTNLLWKEQYRRIDNDTTQPLQD